MSNDADRWIVYADENLAIAQMALEGGYYNACLQNIQQAVEKYLKAVLLGRGLLLQKTHNISTLNDQIEGDGVSVLLSDEDCALLDSIYLPSKYPFGSALPDFNPDEDICGECIRIAEKVRAAIMT